MLCCVLLRQKNTNENEKRTAKLNLPTAATTPIKREWKKKLYHKSPTWQFMFRYLLIHIIFLFLLCILFFLDSMFFLSIVAPEMKKSEYAHACMSYWGKIESTITGKFLVSVYCVHTICKHTRFITLSSNTYIARNFHSNRTCCVNLYYVQLTKWKEVKYQVKMFGFFSSLFFF